MEKCLSSTQNNTLFIIIIICLACLLCCSLSVRLFIFFLNRKKNFEYGEDRNSIKTSLVTKIEETSSSQIIESKLEENCVDQNNSISNVKSHYVSKDEIQMISCK